MLPVLLSAKEQGLSMEQGLSAWSRSMEGRVFKPTFNPTNRPAAPKAATEAPMYTFADICIHTGDTRNMKAPPT